MIDEYFDFFLSEFGKPTDKINATVQQVETYRDVLPNQLLEYWQVVGFSGFMDGLFWITNPADFDDVLDTFLVGTGFEKYDNYHVIARSVYGELYLWGERTGYSLVIKPSFNWIKTKKCHALDIEKGRADLVMQRFFAVLEPSSVDMELKSKPLFPSVLKKYGSIDKDEVMVFNPYLFMGGKKSVDNMSKENLHIFLQVMAELGGAEIIDMASMVGNVIKHYEK